MGQKPSHSPTKPKLSLTWVLRTPHHQSQSTRPEQPIKFHYRTRRKSVELTGKDVQVTPTRTKSEPSLLVSGSERTVREKHRHRKRQRKSGSRFGYEIEDVDAFLAKASLDKPANIPVVLAFPTVLYQTRIGYQDEITLPLGMVVNAVFKNQTWLYVQTPHAEEGYVAYTACLPLGILPPRRNSPSPCWDNSTDVFPHPCGNRTDTEKLSECGERSVDRLYLKACARNRGGNGAKRQTLLVVGMDFRAMDQGGLSVCKGDVVVLVGAPVKDWFWVRARDGSEGFIPAKVAGHGFL